MLRRALALLALVALPAARGGAQTLTPYNAFTLGSFQLTNSDVRGRVAAGGNATLTSFGVGAGLASGFSDFALVVGGALNATNGQVSPATSRTWVGGATTLSSATVPNRTSAAPAPVDFAAEGARLRAISDAIAASSATTVSGSALTFTATSNGVNVFRVNASALQAAGAYNVNFGAFTSATILIDVVGSVNAGTSLFANTGIFIDGQQGNGPTPRPGTERLLWNVANVGGLQGSLLLNASLAGSLLAPRSNLTSGYSQIVGNVVVNNWNSTTQLYTGGIFTGQLPTVVPEPATLALVGGGLGVLGLAARRRRR